MNICLEFAPYRTEERKAAARRALESAPSLFCLAWLAWATAAASGATYYVATNGQDTATGTTAEAALRTIQRAANLAQAGDTVQVGAGIYREYVTFPRSGSPSNWIELAAAPGESPVLTGSEVVTNWVLYSNHIWVVTNWPVNSQQVFDNGQPVTQLGWPNENFAIYSSRYMGAGGKGLADMTPNTFYYDRTNLVLYVWLKDNAVPPERTIEVSVRLGAINARNMWGATNAYYRVRGLRVRHSNTCGFADFGWPAVWLPGQSVLQDCWVEWTDSAGISMGTNALVTNCVLACNGMMGGAAGPGFVLTHSLVVSNNYRNFSPVWAASGLKFIPDLHGVIEHCEVAWNNGPGIWFDTCRTGEPIVVRHNYVHHNAQNALFIEITKNAHVHHNLLVSNQIRSVYISSSEDVRVEHNTIAGHQNWMAVEMFYAPTRTNEAGIPFALRNNRFVNNIVYGARSVRDLLMYGDDPPYCQNNQSDYNCYYRGGGEYMAMNRTGASALVFTSLAPWQAATGWDTHSLAADPLFVDPSRGEYHLSSQGGTLSNGVWVLTPGSSPCIDTGDPAAPFNQEPPWNGNRVNMGRYGNTPEAAKSLDRDGDGASDTLESNVLYSDPELKDTDGDAADDYTEYVAGTDPLDHGSALRLSAALAETLSGSAIELSWFGAAARRYVVQSSAELISGSWAAETGLLTPVGEPVDAWTGSNGWIRVLYPGLRPEARRFFRLDVSWP